VAGFRRLCGLDVVVASGGQCESAGESSFVGGVMKAISSSRGLATRRSWTVNGAITWSRRNEYFYTDVKEQNKELLLPSIESGSYVVLHAPRASGKSTRMDAAVEQLEETGKYTVLKTSLQSGVVFGAEESFWKSFGGALQRDNVADVPLIESAGDFAAGLAKSGPFKKPVVLVVDEFDLLYGAAPEQVQDSVLNVLRWLRQEKKGTWLHSFVAMGPFSILELTGKSGCPFNSRDAVQSPPFTEAQVEDLFAQFSRERGLTLDRRIVRDVFDRTEGHAGCVGFCGKEMDETLLRGVNTISYETWMRYATLKLDSRMGTWPTMQKMIDELALPESIRASAKEKERIPHVVEAREQLCSVYLTTSQAVRCSSQGNRRYARYLAAEGALAPDDGGVAFRIRAPLIRSLLINSILPLLRRPCPTKPVPVDESGMLIMEDVVETALGYFKPSVMRDLISQKMSSAPRMARTLVPQEDAYQTELLYVLKSWFGEGIRVVSQPIAVVEGDQKKGRPRHSDILIDFQLDRVVVELVAHTGVAGVQEHVERAERDARVLGASQVWVLHFTTADFGQEWPSEKLDVSMSSIPIRVMDIKHDPAWSVAMVRMKGTSAREISLGQIMH
jgi:hypothetical protein